MADDAVVIERMQRATLRVAYSNVLRALEHLHACSELEVDDPLRKEAHVNLRRTLRHAQVCSDAIVRRYA